MPEELKRKIWIKATPMDGRPLIGQDGEYSMDFTGNHIRYNEYEYNSQSGSYGWEVVKKDPNGNENEENLTPVNIGYALQQ